MRYFSFASKYRALGNNKRAISYKIRKSIIYSLSRMEKQSRVDNNEINFANKATPQQCTRFSVHVMTNGSMESNGLLLQTDKESYLFNCGEGVQRIAATYGIKLIRTFALFVTYHTWSNIGGIMGTALSLRTLGVKELIIYGPPAIKDIITAAEFFVRLKPLTVKVITDSERITFDDGILKLKSVPLYNNNLKKSVHKSNSESNVGSNVKIKDEPGHKSVNHRSRSEARGATPPPDVFARCYICQTPEFGHHLDIQACLEKGVPIGPLLGLLRNRKDVTLKDGRKISWKDVCTSGYSNTVMVIDCPTTDYLESLLNEPAFSVYQNSSHVLIIHFTPQEVMSTSEYKEWMRQFPKTTKHIKINSDNSCLDIMDIYHIQTKFNFLCDHLFPVLGSSDLPFVKDEFSGKIVKNSFSLFTCENEETEKQIDKELSRKDAPSLFSARNVLKNGPNIFEYFDELSVMRGLPSLTVQFHPKQNFDCSHSVLFDPSNSVNEIVNVDTIMENLKELNNFIKTWTASDEYKNLPDYPKILFLGTGSSVPSKYRCTSSILIYLNEDNLILLDCGEGTYQQLCRFFGYEKLVESMKKLKMIFVSHHHADHHLGLINILIARQKILQMLKRNQSDAMEKQPLLLLIPPTISQWLSMINGIYGSLLQDTKVVYSYLYDKSFIKEYLSNIGLSDLKICQVSHCSYSTGITLTDKNNYRITYSGDCRPSSSLIAIGKNSDVLIHEATFEDDLVQMATSKRHSTISEAIDMGREMRAKFTLLTHFSQRYAHVPQVPENFPENAAIAFDNMMVSSKTLPIASKMLKFYQMAYADKLEKLRKRELKLTLDREPVPPKMKNNLIL